MPLCWAPVDARAAPWDGDVFPKKLMFSCLLPLALSLSTKLANIMGPITPAPPAREATFNYLASLPAPDFAISVQGQPSQVA